MLRPCNWCPWLSGLGGCVTCMHYAVPLCEKINEWVASHWILVFAHRFFGIATGQTLQLTGRNCVSKVCSDVQKNDFRERLSLFRRSFIKKWIRVMLIQEKSKFLFEKPCIISRFWTHTSKSHQTCFLGVIHIYETFPVKKKNKETKTTKNVQNRNRNEIAA